MSRKSNRLKRRVRELVTQRSSFLDRWLTMRDRYEAAVHERDIYMARYADAKKKLDRLAFVDVHESTDLLRITKTLSLYEIERLRGSEDDRTQFLTHVVEAALEELLRHQPRKARPHEREA